MITERGLVAHAGRRPVGLRESRSVQATARWLSRVGIRPNHVSGASVMFAALAAACLLTPSAHPGWRSARFLAAAAFILLRGLCNLCDGLMAIEGGAKSRSGEVFNDLPDRISDPLLLVAAAYSITGVTWARELGWLAALLAVLTAYVRVLGVSAGAPQQYCGPMAKTDRMALLVMACVGAALESALGWPGRAMPLALATIALGSAVTVARRTARIVRALESA